jgi:hypothetical protein
MANFALVIGINAYENLPGLNGAARDALEVCEWLMKWGHVPGPNIYLCLSPTDDETSVAWNVNRTGATETEIFDAWHHLCQDLQSEVNGGERFYFYYSGYGLRGAILHGNLEDALVPKNYGPSVNAFSLDSLFKACLATPFREQFFFIDACRDAVPKPPRLSQWPLPEEFAASEAEVAQKAGPVPDEASREQFAMFATAPGVKAREIGEEGKERGAFTLHLLKGLKGEAAERDYKSNQNVVRFNNLFDFTRKQLEGSKVPVGDEVAPERIQRPRRGGESGGSDPILATFRPGGAAQGVLSVAYAALKEEFSRIEEFVLERSPAAKRLLEEHAKEVLAQFKPHLLELRIKIKEISEAIDNKQPRMAWEAYGEARGRLLPTLANDLLAAIGGLFLRRFKLDVAGIGEGSTEPALFANLAEKLVEQDLASRIGEKGYPVLIVGEERPEVSGAVIRLRFPAWDLWNLPLTAHEFGYILSVALRPEHREPSSDPIGDQEYGYRLVRTMGALYLVYFDRFCDKIRAQVDPSTHKDGIRPGTAGCFLPEVREFWDAYYNEAPGKARQEFLKKHKHRIAFLKAQQHQFMCRLFADAFGVLFGGPAYLHSILNLRLWPGEAALPEMPPFADRFVFALGILQKMDAHPAYRTAKGTPFQAEIEKLSELWNLARAEAEIEASDAKLVEQYKEWVDEIYKCFGAYKDSIEPTYSYWSQSRDLAKVLQDPARYSELWPEDHPNIWAVLNAAWTARWLVQPDEEKLKAVIENALTLLDETNFRLISPPKFAPRDAAGQREVPVRQASQESPRPRSREPLADDRLERKRNGQRK